MVYTVDESIKFIEGIISIIIQVEDDIEENWKQITLSNLDNTMNRLDQLFIKLQEILKQIGILNQLGLIQINENYIMNSFLKLIDAMKIPDCILIGDITRYEIKPILSNWKNLLYQTANKITKSGYLTN